MNNRFKIRTLFCGLLFLATSLTSCMHSDPPLKESEGYFLKYSQDQWGNCQSYKGGIGEIDLRDNLKLGNMEGNWDEYRCQDEIKVPKFIAHEFACVDLTKFKYLLVTIEEDSIRFFVPNEDQFPSTCN